MRSTRPQDFRPGQPKKITPESVDVSDISPIKNPLSTDKKVDIQDEKSDQQVVNRTPERFTGRTSERSNGFYTFTPRQRIRVRSSFEMYQDQVAKLNELEINAKMKGEKFSRSDIVRTALDKYFEEIGE